jgi:hypothetical protein
MHSTFSLFSVALASAAFASTIPPAHSEAVVAVPATISSTNPISLKPEHSTDAAVTQGLQLFTGLNCGGTEQQFDLTTTPKNICTKPLFAYIYSAQVYSFNAQSVPYSVRFPHFTRWFLVANYFVTQVSVSNTACSTGLTIPHVNTCYNFLDNNGANIYINNFISQSGVTFQ